MFSFPWGLSCCSPLVTTWLREVSLVARDSAGGAVGLASRGLAEARGWTIWCWSCMWGLVQWASSYWWSWQRSHKRLNRFLWGWHRGWFWQWGEVGSGFSGNMLMCWWLLSMVHLGGCACAWVYFLKSLISLPNVHLVEDSWVFG